MHQHTLTLSDADLCLILRALAILTTDDLEDEQEIVAVRDRLPTTRSYRVEKQWSHKARDDAHRSEKTVARFDRAVKFALSDDNDPYLLDEAVVRDEITGETVFNVSPAGRRNLIDSRTGLPV